MASAGAASAGGGGGSQAGAASAFANGWFTRIQNKGTGPLVITPTTSTICGAATLTIYPGQTQKITSDGTNYQCDGGTTGTVTVAGVLGNTAANGSFAATVVDSTHLSLNGSVGNGAYAGGGNVEAGDLGQIDQLLQQNVTPDGIAGAITVSALAFPQKILGTVVVPQANVAAYRLAVVPAIQAYLASIPIGGLFSDEAVPVEYDLIIGALTAAGILNPGQQSVVRALQGVTLNGGQVDVPFPSNLYQALLDPATSIAVVGV